jgi:hypothetical protein
VQEQSREHLYDWNAISTHTDGLKLAERGDAMALETQRREDHSESNRVSMGRHMLRRRVGAAPEKKE